MWKLWIVTIHGWTITKHKRFVQHYTGSMPCTNSYSIAIEYSAMLWSSNLAYSNSSSSWLATHTLLRSYLLKLCVMWCHYYPVDVCAAGLCVWLHWFVCVCMYVIHICTECIWTSFEKILLSVLYYVIVECKYLLDIWSFLNTPYLYLVPILFSPVQDLDHSKNRC